MVTRGLLMRLGCDVTVVSSGRECLQIILQPNQVFKVLLLDVCMPDMDGYEVAIRIQENLARHERPILVALTANTDKATRDRCLSLGMDGVILKPITLEKMRMVLTELLERGSFLDPLVRRMWLSISRVLPLIVSDNVGASALWERCAMETLSWREACWLYCQETQVNGGPGCTTCREKRLCIYSRIQKVSMPLSTALCRPTPTGEHGHPVWLAVLRSLLPMRSYSLLFKPKQLICWKQFHEISALLSYRSRSVK